MLNDLFINILILIAITFVGGNVLKEIPSSITTKWYMRILLGVSGGLLGILMINYNIQTPGTIARLDLRAIIFLMINYVSVGVPIIIAGIIIGTFRIMYWGVDEASIVAIIDIILFLLVFYIINKKVMVLWKNWFFKLAAIIIILLVSMFFLLRNMENTFIVVIAFVGLNAVAGGLVFFLLEYVRRSNELLRMYKESATTDYLTGLNNTRNFDKLLNSSFETAIEKNEKLACLMIDIDYFKKVNDTYGHAVGDIVLKGLAGILSKSSRAFDIIARVGGEEFCIILLDCSLERAFEIGTRIKENVKRHKFDIGDNKHIKITVSIGVAAYPDPIQNLDEIMKQADNALYRAKSEGRDRVCDNAHCIK